MTAIREIRAREVLDSRGNPTVEVEVACDGPSRGRAIVPAGASTGRHEAVEQRDRDAARFGGKGVLQAVAHVHQIIAPALVGQDVTDQAALDQLLVELDATPNKSRLGANAILGVSLACAHAAAAAKNVPLFEHLHLLFKDLATVGQPQVTLPLPMVNMISGGLHAGGQLDMQDFLVLPVGATTFRQALEHVVAVYRSLAGRLAAGGYEAVLVGDEGGYGPRLESNRQALELLVDSIRAAGFEPGRDIAIGIDVASSHFFQNSCYSLTADRNRSLTGTELVELLAGWVDQFPIISIEDGCAEDDWDSWRLLSDRLGDRVQLIGDDLFATNPARLAQGIERGVANAVLVKLNQIGTLTETLRVIAQSHEAGYRTVVSARSGETEDCTIAHLAVGTGAGQIKIGSIARSERLAKYNELLRIEQSLGERAVFAADAAAPSTRS